MGCSVPFRVTDNGKLFVAQLRNGMGEEVPNAIAATYLGDNQWGESYGEYGAGELTQEGGGGIANMESTLIEKSE